VPRKKALATRPRICLKEGSRGKKGRGRKANTKSRPVLPDSERKGTMQEIGREVHESRLTQDTPEVKTAKGFHMMERQVSWSSWKGEVHREDRHLLPKLQPMTERKKQKRIIILEKKRRRYKTRWQ